MGVPTWKTATLPFVARRHAAVTPHATTLMSSLKSDGSWPGALFVGGAGTVVVQGHDDEDTTFTVGAGTTIPVMAKRVKASGTTATGIIALFP